MIKADFHTHCNFSTDSDAKPEDMIQSAIKKGLHHLCLTDHMDLGYPGSTEEEPLFSFCPEHYFQALVPLQEKYVDSSHSFHLSIGVELGLRPNRPDLKQQAEQLLSDYPFDFVLGSLHLIDDADPYYPEFWNTVFSPSAILRTYFDRMLTALHEFDHFDSLGHIDYLIRYIPAAMGAKDYSYSEFKEVMDEILKILIKKDKALEINTAGLIKGLSCFHPKTEVVKRYLELGGELLTIGSDGHSPDKIATEFRKTEELLSSLGIKGYYVYCNHKPDFIPF